MMMMKMKHHSDSKLYVCMYFIFRNTFAFHIATTDNMSKVCVLKDRQA